VNIPNTWKGDRNPVKYATLEELGIDPSKLKWEAMPEVSDKTEERLEVVNGKSNSVRALTMSDAKKGLALTFGVAPEAVEITIRG
jgi:hypothetical protein